MQPLHLSHESQLHVQKGCRASPFHMSGVCRTPEMEMSQGEAHKRAFSHNKSGRASCSTVGNLKLLEREEGSVKETPDVMGHEI